VRGIGGVKDPYGAVGIPFIDQLLAELWRDKIVPAAAQFFEKSGADSIDIVGGESAAGEEIYRVCVAGLFIIERWAFIIEVLPEFGSVDSHIFNPGEVDIVGMDIMDGEEAGDTEATGGSGDKAGHPVVTMDEVGVNGRDNMVNHLPLQGESQPWVLFIVVTVNGVTVVKAAIFSEVDTAISEAALVDTQLFIDETCGIDMKHAAVMGQSHVNISTKAE